ncbi:myosin XVB isoform X2 [Protopterus annectens]|uniref:myosin XVB isoform X2 n=1 Tax=Protopterus annectens TaxID=7888 RepID=UPI001CFC2AAF|nr:myosin XVB isoform X2 [Protopterus annectens]
MNVGRLEIPADLAALLRSVNGYQSGSVNQIAEVSPPHAKASFSLSLPSNVNNFPFSKFIEQHFQIPEFQSLETPLQKPLTHLEGEESHIALQLFKVILRFMGDLDLQDKELRLVGNYIIQKGISNPQLRDEIFCQLANQTWKTRDTQWCQRVWLLLANCLGCFLSSPELEKPLLKYSSDFAIEGYKAICQHKALRAIQQKQSHPGPKRNHPATQLEWTATERRGKMVLEVFTYNEDSYTVEVDSWTTGEELAAWFHKSRDSGEALRGWTVSMLTNEGWRDLNGTDYVLDLIAETEDMQNLLSSQPDYPITPEWEQIPHTYQSNHRNVFNDNDMNIPPAPNIQAPFLPPSFNAPEMEDDIYASTIYEGSESRRGTSIAGMDNYVDDLFHPVLSSGTSGLERPSLLNRKMKGGGKVGPTRTGVFTGAGMPTMAQYPQMPAYPSMPVMGGMMQPAMPAMAPMGAMPMMQAMPPMMMPQVIPQPQVPTVDPTQIMAQQQTFINQQALLLAQQMTLQAVNISQQQIEKEQEKQRNQQQEKECERENKKEQLGKKKDQEKEKPKQSTSSTSADSITNSSIPPAPPLPTAPTPKPKPKPVVTQQPLSEPEAKSQQDEDEDQLESFKKKREFFQKIGQQQESKPKVPVKIQLPKPEKPEKTAALEPTKNGSPPDMVLSSDKDTNPEPSQEIRSIIKMYQQKPPPPLQAVVYEPVRKPTNQFLKKNDPKEEALTMLGLNEHRPPAPPPEKKKAPVPSPALVQKPTPSTPPVKKQHPLENLFTPPPHLRPPPPAQLHSVLPLPPPPPPPPISTIPSQPSPLLADIPPPPSTQAPNTVPSKNKPLEDTHLKTQMYQLTASVFFSYVSVDWKLFLRKEVFYPKEKFNHPYVLNLLCKQIMRDTYSETCLRISKEERRKMKDMLAEFHVGTDITSLQDDAMKKRIVVAARDNWANYFSRLFPASGDSGSDIQYLGISHKGFKLLKLLKSAGFHSEHLKVLRGYSYADLISVETPNPSTLEFSLKNENLVVYSTKAPLVKAMVELFLNEVRKDSKYVMAIQSYITDDKSLLTFQKGDVIQLLPMEEIQQGWQFGSIGNRSGLFPSHYVQPTATPDFSTMHAEKQNERRKSISGSLPDLVLNNKEIDKKEVQPTEDVNKMAPVQRQESLPASNVSDTTEHTATTNSSEVNQYTMVEFATKHFREAVSSLGWKGLSAEGRNPASLVHHTKVPIQESLISFSDNELNEHAVQCFSALMKFMGDQPSQRNQDETIHIYTILQLCKEIEGLRDEVYCQVIKQITNNPKPESCIRGWRILNLLTGYFPCSNTLRPYVTKYLQEAGFEPGNSYREIAKLCEENLRRSLLYGGRRNPPSQLEMEAILKGRSSRRVPVHLPGGKQYTIKLRTFTVAAEVLREICAELGVTEHKAVKEYALFVEKNNGETVRPVRQEECIYDFLLDDNKVKFGFRRIMWKEPLHFENDMYIDIHYSQVFLDYMKETLLLPSKISHMEDQLAKIVALHYKAQGSAPNPNQETLPNFLPKSLLDRVNVPKLLKKVIQVLNSLTKNSPLEAKVVFLELLATFPLFGYNAYLAEKSSEQKVIVPCFVAVNHEQIQILNRKSQDVFFTIKLQQVQALRTLRPNEGTKLPGIEIHYGSPKTPQAIWFELKQAKELCHIITAAMKEFASHT